MNLDSSNVRESTVDIWNDFTNSKGILVKWQAEVLKEIVELKKELKYLLDKRELLKVKIECFDKWQSSAYSQLKFKTTVELEQINKDTVKAERKEVFLRELLKKIESEIKNL
jgi:hypothetical protein